MKAIELITDEQEHQREIGFTPEHDSRHVKGELGRAAVCIAELAVEGDSIDWPHPFMPEDFLALSDHVADKSQVELLVIAAALIASEIDRILVNAGLA